MVRARCECSLIKFKVTDSIKSLSYCHCGQCRRLHGAAYASWVRIDTKSLHILAGGNHLKIYASSNELNRYFCANCGSSIMCRPKFDPTRSWLALGILDGVFDLPEGEHKAQLQAVSSQQAVGGIRSSMTKIAVGIVIVMVVVVAVSCSGP